MDDDVAAASSANAPAFEGDEGTRTTYPRLSAALIDVSMTSFGGFNCSSPVVGADRRRCAAARGHFGPGGIFVFHPPETKTTLLWRRRDDITSRPFRATDDDVNDDAGGVDIPFARFVWKRLLEDGFQLEEEEEEEEEELVEQQQQRQQQRQQQHRCFSSDAKMRESVSRSVVVGALLSRELIMTNCAMT